MNYLQNNTNYIPPSEKNKAIKSSKKEKIVKQKVVKEKVVKQKEEEKVDEKVELTQDQFIQSIICDKIEETKKKLEELKSIEKIIVALERKNDEEIILNERRNIINKSLAKINMKNKDKEHKEELFNDLKKKIKFYDTHFEIDSEKLLVTDFKF
jgi:hypothetical protein